MRINISDPPSTPVVSVQTVTLYHNASIPSTDGYLCAVINFGVLSRFLGTTLDSKIDNSFWNWSAGFALIRRQGIGSSDILLDKQVIVAQKAVKVMPVGNGEAILVADLGGTGASHNYFETADGDRFPVFDFPAVSIATFPQLRAASSGSSQFKANFGTNMAVPMDKGGGTRFSVFSSRGKVITVEQGSSTDVLYLDAAHTLCHTGAADITASTASTLNSISPFGQARTQIYINANNSESERFEHDFAFIPRDLYLPLDDTNTYVKVKFNANAASQDVVARWSASNSRVEANMAGSANISMKAATDYRPDQGILGI